MRSAFPATHSLRLNMCWFFFVRTHSPVTTVATEATEFSVCLNNMGNDGLLLWHFFLNTSHFQIECLFFELL